MLKILNFLIYLVNAINTLIKEIFLIYFIFSAETSKSMWGILTFSELWDPKGGN